MLGIQVIVHCPKIFVVLAKNVLKVIVILSETKGNANDDVLAVCCDAVDRSGGHERGDRPGRRGSRMANPRRRLMGRDVAGMESIKKFDELFETYLRRL